MPSSKRKASGRSAVTACTPTDKPSDRISKSHLKILIIISFSHFLNDMLQSLIPAVYPQLKTDFSLTFTQIGLITLTYQLFASLLQPVVGMYTDYRPRPYFLAMGMGATAFGMVFLAIAPSYLMLLLAVSLVGVGSSIFHPESSRVARMASDGRFGMAQSLFQVGGNIGAAVGPLAAALVLVPLGRHSLMGFSAFALLGMGVLWMVGNWYREEIRQNNRKSEKTPVRLPIAPARTVVWPLFILVVLIFSKFFYTASLSSYLIFYMMNKFGVSVSIAQIYLFVFLLGAALGTLVGGPIGDRTGRKQVICGSIFGAAPFALMLPHASLFWTGPLAFLVGLIMASSFPAILVYGQELIPGKVGMVSGLFFGVGFGFAGMGAAFLGKVADIRGILYVYDICAFLPLLGALGIFLPDSRKPGIATG